MAGATSDVAERWREFFRGQYHEAVAELASTYPDERSLYVDVLDLHEFDASFASALLSNPDRLLRLGSAVLRDLEDDLGRVNVRLTNHPGLLPIGRLRTRHAGEIVTVEGAITAVGEVQARIDLARFECAACGATATTRTTGRRLPDPLRCEECGAHGTMSLRPGQSRHVDVQRVTIEGAGPDDAPHGLEAFLDDDLVDAVRPGEEVVLTGVLRLAATDEPNRFDFYLDGITVEESRPVDPDAVGDAADDIQSLIRERWQFAVDR